VVVDNGGCQNAAARLSEARNGATTSVYYCYAKAAKNEHI